MGVHAIRGARRRLDDTDDPVWLPARSIRYGAASGATSSHADARISALMTRALGCRRSVSRPGRAVGNDPADVDGSGIDHVVGMPGARIDAPPSPRPISQSSPHHDRLRTGLGAPSSFGTHDLEADARKDRGCAREVRGRNDTSVVREWVTGSTSRPGTPTPQHAVQHRRARCRRRPVTSRMGRSPVEP